MHDLFLAAHFIGLMMGAAGGMGSMIIMRRAAAAPPEQGAALRGLGPQLGRFAALGVTLMWLSGVALVCLHGGFGALPAMFWVKFVFVTTLTLAAIAIELTYAQIKSGKVAAAARLPVIGPIAGVSSLLAVIFAVIAFH